jgi:hypothetical protein
MTRIENSCSKRSILTTVRQESNETGAKIFF